MDTRRRWIHEVVDAHVDPLTDDMAVIHFQIDPREDSDRSMQMTREVLVRLRHQIDHLLQQDPPPAAHQ